jgi:hypothetical protein
MKNLIHRCIILLAFSFLSCKGKSKEDKQTDPTEKKETKDSATVTPTTTDDHTTFRVDTIAALTDFSDQANETYFKSSDGNKYRVTLVDPSAEEEAIEDAGLDCNTDNIHATHRRTNKFSLVNKRYEPKFHHLSQFIATLQRDNDMRSLANLTTDPENPRVAQEKRNVTLVNVYLYAIKREADNDYHLIVGDNNGLYFNVECSGLPGRDYPGYETLLKVRRQIEDYFKSEFCTTKYTKFDPGIKLFELSGSLFYDIDHTPGVVGPEGYKPRTAWEIHPISNIDFGNNR